jgi:hypothetical protein
MFAVEADREGMYSVFLPASHYRVQAIGNSQECSNVLEVNLTNDTHLDLSSTAHRGTIVVRPPMECRLRDQCRTVQVSLDGPGLLRPATIDLVSGVTNTITSLPEGHYHIEMSWNDHRASTVLDVRQGGSSELSWHGDESLSVIQFPPALDHSAR